RRHTRSKRDWSSDVCSSDLVVYAENANSVKGLLNHQVKPYEDGPAIDTVSGNSSSTTRRYYRSYRSDLGVSGVYDRGDRISFERSEERRVGQDSIAEMRTVY